MNALEYRISQALNEADYWAREADRLEEKARLCRLREQQRRNEANGEPLKILDQEKVA